MKARFFLPSLLVFCLMQPASSWAFALQDSYIPPEVAFAENLHQRVELSEQFNLNGMNLDELKSLPGISEDIALKILRSRPFSDIQDFYKRMPDASHKQLNLWIRQLQPKLQFK